MDAGIQAREAFAQRDWQTAYDLFTACVALGPDDHDALAESGHWLGLPGVAIASYGEAYRLHLAAGSPRRPVRLQSRHLPPAPR